MSRSAQPAFEYSNVYVFAIDSDRISTLKQSARMHFVRHLRWAGVFGCFLAESPDTVHRCSLLLPMLHVAWSVCLCVWLKVSSVTVRYDTIRYDTIRQIYVRSKADEMASLI